MGAFDSLLCNQTNEPSVFFKVQSLSGYPFNWQGYQSIYCSKYDTDKHGKMTVIIFLSYRPALCVTELMCE